MGHDNVLIHVIEHNIVLTQIFIFQQAKTGKWSDVISNLTCNIEQARIISMICNEREIKLNDYSELDKV
jgi:hypothetical protein